MSNLWEGKLVRLRAVEPDDWKIFHEWDKDGMGGRFTDEVWFPGSTVVQQKWAEDAATHKPDNDEYRFQIESLAGELVGTTFQPGVRRIAARKLWIGFASQVDGVISVDDGARRALVERGTSLLPAGVTGVVGSFDEGDVVEVRDLSNAVVARGMVRGRYNGRDANGEFRYTRVWAQRGGRWYAVAAHSSMLPPPSGR